MIDHNIGMDVEQWLATKFTQSLEHESLIYANEADVLRGQLTVLRDCGVLDEQAFTDAQHRLDSAIDTVRERTRFRVERGTPWSKEPRAATLRRVLAVGEPVAAVDSMRIVLTSVELWSDRTNLFLAAIPQPVNDEQWQSGHGEPSLSLFRADRLLQAFGVRVSDDVATTYRMAGSASGASEDEWRLNSYHHPGVPQEARQLIVEVFDNERRQLAGTMRLPLPVIE